MESKDDNKVDTTTNSTELKSGIQQIQKGKNRDHYILIPWLGEKIVSSFFV